MNARYASFQGRCKDELTTAIDLLFASPPQLHRPKDFNPSDDPAAEDGLVGTWGIQESFLRVLVELVTPDCLTLETGSGLSTVCFAIVGSEHVCVSPSPKEHARIRRYCADHGISTERTQFVPAKSDAVLPSLDLGGRKLDLALIDGAHAFPIPIMDYYFVDRHLKVGGFLAIDDLQIPSVGLVHRFLLSDSAYELLSIDAAKTGLYRKVHEPSYPRDWVDQKFNSKNPDLSFLDFGARVRRHLAPLEFRLREGLGKVPGLRPLYRRFKDRAAKRNG